MSDRLSVPAPAARLARAVGVALGLAVLASPGAALAQGVWTVTPSLRVAEEYTDNVFGTASNRESDFITQITPGLALAYETPILKIFGSYDATAEIYADHSDLDNFGDNQRGVFTLDYQPEERLRLRLAGYYTRTNDPSTLTVFVTPPGGVVGIPTVETTRRQTEVFTLSAGGDYRFTPRLTGRAQYVFSYLEQDQASDSRSHTGSIGADYQLTQRDVGLATVSVSTINSDDSDTSAALLLGWRRQWSADLVTSIAVGPRVTDGTWGGAAEVSATYLITREWTATLTYSLGTGLAAGTTGAQNVSALSGSVAYQATRDLRFAAGGAWTRTWPLDGGPDERTTNAYFASVSASYQITTWLVATLAYRYSLEETTTGDSIPTNQVVLGLTASYPWVLGR